MIHAIQFIQTNQVHISLQPKVQSRVSLYTQYHPLCGEMNRTHYYAPSGVCLLASDIIALKD